MRTEKQGRYHFNIKKQIVNETQEIDVETMKSDVPALEIVPIPNLQNDEVNVLFDMEVHESAGSEEKAVASVIGINEPSGFKVDISGAVSQNPASAKLKRQNLPKRPKMWYNIPITSAVLTAPGG